MASSAMARVADAMSCLPWGKFRAVSFPPLPQRLSFSWHFVYRVAGRLAPQNCPDFPILPTKHEGTEEGRDKSAMAVWEENVGVLTFSFQFSCWF